MQAFKIQPIKINTILKDQTQNSQTLNDTLKLSITNIQYLNYPIGSLITIIDQHFNEEPPSANIVCKALKILSISFKDQQLKKQFHNVISKNSQKKYQLYLLVKYWLSFVRADKIMAIFDKIDENVVNLLVTATISYYFFSATDQNRRNCEISKFISIYFARINSKDNCKSVFQGILRNIKDQFLMIDFSFRNLMIKSVQVYGQAIDNFLKTLLPWILKNQNTQKQFQTILISYLQSLLDLSFNQSQQKQQKQQQTTKKQLIKITNKFFDTFLYISQFYITNLQKLFTKQTVFKLWLILMLKNQQQKQNTNNNNNNKSNILFDENIMKLNNLIKSAIKQYINLSKNYDRYWQIMQQYYGKSITEYTVAEVKYQILGMGTQLDNQNILGEFIIKKYMFNYFQGKNFELEEESLFVKRCYSTNQENKAMVSHKIGHSNLDALNQMIHGLQNCSSKGGINLICINKIYSIKNWQKINILSSDYDKKIKQLQKKIVNFEDYYTKLKNLYGKLLQKCQKKGQKLQLAYSVLLIRDKSTNKQAVVTIDQLENYTKQIENDQLEVYQQKLKALDKYQNNHNKESQKVDNNLQKQYHPIVLQAKAIKILKKSKKSLTISQISQQIGQKQQKMNTILQKLINKGYAQINDQQQYLYLP